MEWAFSSDAFDMNMILVVVFLKVVLYKKIMHLAWLARYRRITVAELMFIRTFS